MYVKCAKYNEQRESAFAIQKSVSTMSSLQFFAVSVISSLQLFCVCSLLKIIGGQLEEFGKK